MCNSNLNSVISPPGVLGLPTHSGFLGGDDFLLQASTPSSSNSLKVTFWTSQAGTSVTFTQKQKFKHILISFAGTFRVFSCGTVKWGHFYPSVISALREARDHTSAAALLLQAGISHTCALNKGTGQSFLCKTELQTYWRMVKKP